MADAVPASDQRARETFEALSCSNLTLAMGGRVVHRVRMVTGKDTTPLNALELPSNR